MCVIRIVWEKYNNSKQINKRLRQISVFYLHHKERSRHQCSRIPWEYANLPEKVREKMRKTSMMEVIDFQNYSTPLLSSILSVVTATTVTYYLSSSFFYLSLYYSLSLNFFLCLMCSLLLHCVRKIMKWTHYNCVGTLADLGLQKVN